MARGRCVVRHSSPEHRHPACAATGLPASRVSRSVRRSSSPTGRMPVGRTGWKPVLHARSHVSAFCTTVGNSSSAFAAPNAAQHSAVVEMFDLLRVVSPHPPSAFTCSASQRSPPRMSGDADTPVRTFPPLRTGVSALHPPPRTCSTLASATTAVAVESALDESSPVQCPAAFISASSASVAAFNATATRVISLSLSAPEVMRLRSLSTNGAEHPSPGQRPGLA